MSHEERLVALALQRVQREWGAGFTHLGKRLQAALLAEEILNIAALQDDGVPDSRVRRIIEAGQLWTADWKAENSS